MSEMDREELQHTLTWWTLHEQHVIISLDGPQGDAQCVGLSLAQAMTVQSINQSNK